MYKILSCFPIPANALMSNFSHIQELDSGSIPAIDVCRINGGVYLKESDSRTDLISLQNLCREASPQVICLLGPYGPYATGTLISEDGLLLVARHSIEGISIKDIKAVSQYQYDENQGLSDSELKLYSIDGVVEYGEGAQDYAILKCKGQASERFPYAFLSNESNHLGSSVLIHHPSGEPKKISVNRGVESDCLQLQHNGFHDTKRGSSGAAYRNLDNAIFALHGRKLDGATSAVLVSDILSSNPNSVLNYLINGTAIPKYGVTEPKLKRTEAVGLEVYNTETFLKEAKQFLDKFKECCQGTKAQKKNQENTHGNKAVLKIPNNLDAKASVYIKQHPIDTHQIGHLYESSKGGNGSWFYPFMGKCKNGANIQVLWFVISSLVRLALELKLISPDNSPVIDMGFALAYPSGDKSAPKKSHCKGIAYKFSGDIGGHIHGTNVSDNLQAITINALFEGVFSNIGNAGSADEEFKDIEKNCAPANNDDTGGSKKKKKK